MGFASVAYFVTRNVLLSRQTDAIVEQATDHALQAEALVISEGISSSIPLYRFMDSVSSSPGPHIAILLGEDRWVSGNPLKFGRQNIPAEFVTAAKEDSSVQMRTRIGEDMFLLVGISSATTDMIFFEGVSLQDTVDILNILRIVIFVGGAITIIVSGTISVLIVRRAFSSIRAFRKAAENIGRGSFVPITEPVDRDFWQLRDSFNEMQQSILKRIEREQRFALEVSHELRSPLTTLVTSVELIKQRREELSPDAQTALDLLVVEVERFRQLLLDLLDISRPPESIKLELEVLDTQQFLENVVSRSTDDVPIIRGSGKAAKSNAAPIRFVVDAKLLSQVFTNLIENAHRYAGGVTQISVWRNNNDVLIAVDDAGPGVKQEEREKIFERFTRGEVGAHRRQGLGTGLGLALARERMHLHNGDIWVEDAPGETGARFMLRLPIAPDFEQK